MKKMKVQTHSVAYAINCRHTIYQKLSQKLQMREAEEIPQTK